MNATHEIGQATITHSGEWRRVIVRIPTKADEKYAFLMHAFYVQVKNGKPVHQQFEPPEGVEFPKCPL